MNDLFKRSVSILLALVMVLSVVPGAGIHVHAEENEEEPVTQYTVKFLDDDGTELQSSLVDVGAMPEYTGGPLQREGYSFVEWTPKMVEVSEDAVYTAVYAAVQTTSEEEPETPEVPETPELTQYTVTFLNHDGTVLQTGAVIEGQVPVYSGETPVKAEDETNTYAFSGWTPKLVAASADAEYTAVFAATAKTPVVPEVPETPEIPEVPEEPVVNQYTIQFMDWDGTILEELTVDEGVVPVYSGNEPVRPEDETYVYKFAGWDSDYDFEYDPDVDVILPATEDKVYLAAYLYAYNPNAVMTAATLSGVSGLTYTPKSTGKGQFKVTAPTSDSLRAFCDGWALTSFITTTGAGTITFTNSLTTEAVLSFTCTITQNPGSVKADGYTTLNSSKTSASYSIPLAAGGKIVFTITGVDGGDSYAEFTGIKLTADDGNSVTTTFEAPSLGSYTVNDGSATVTIAADAASNEIDNAPTTQYVLTATPGSGNKFVGWFDATNSKYLSIDNPVTMSFDKATTVKPIIVTEDTAIFKVGETYHTDLDYAILYAQDQNIKQILLYSSGSISKSSYEIPSGYTLLIPYDDVGTAYGATPVTEQVPNTIKTPTAKLFRKLTLAPNTTITVNGNAAIEVGAQHWTCHGGINFGGTPISGYGQIEMGSGSSIVLKSGANLYAWGYVTGSGSVTAKSGAKISEMMSVADYNGGSFSDEIVGEKVFPFNQYYIQSVEVEETIESGATLVCWASVYNKAGYLTGDFAQESSVDFMGGSSAMFALGSGTSVTKRYDAASDRLILDVDGNISMNAISIMGYATSDFVLPLNQNLTVNINSGTTTIAQDIMVEPGAKLNVASGATLSLQSGKSLYLMDAASWGNFCFAAQTKQIAYVGSRAGAPVARSLKDSSLNINGTLIADGNLYAASDDIQIISSGKTGTVAFNAAPPAASTIKQCAIENNAVAVKNIAVAAPYLTNGDKSTVNTDGAAAGTFYYYCKPCNIWYTGEHVHVTVSFDANGGEGTMNTVDVVKGNTYTLPKSSFTKTGYDFVGWDVNGASKQPGESITVNADTPVKAVWVIKTFEVTWMNGTTPIYNEDEVPYNTTPVYKSENPTKESDANKHYTFAGWSTTEGGNALSTLPAITGDTTFYAVYTAAGHQWDAGVITTAPTCTDEGVKTYTCECGYEKTENVANLGHKYSLTGYSWSADGKTCTANGTCSRCGTTITADGKITATVKTAASCTVKGTTTYTATFDVSWAKTQTKDVQDIPLADHAFNSKKGTQKTAGTCVAEAVYAVQCDNCTAESENLTVTGEKDPANHTGELKYTNDGDTHSAAYECCDESAVSGEEHTYTDGSCICGAEEPANDINVIVKGNITYSVSGQVVTVTHSIPCKVGYWDAASSKYVAIKNPVSADGSYSFTAPDGVTEVLLVVKGDVTGEGLLNAGDTGKLNAYILKRGSLTAEAMFAAEVTGEGLINAGDTGKINSTILKRGNFTWG